MYNSAIHDPADQIGAYLAKLPAGACNAQPSLQSCYAHVILVTESE